MHVCNFIGALVAARVGPLLSYVVPTMVYLHKYKHTFSIGNNVMPLSTEPHSLDAAFQVSVRTFVHTSHKACTNHSLALRSVCSESSIP